MSHRAREDVLKQRKIVTARRGGGKSLSPPPSRQRSATAMGSSSKVGESMMIGRKIVKAVRPSTPINKSVCRLITKRAARQEDAPPRPPSPCRTPPRSSTKRHGRPKPCKSWNRSMKAALVCVTMNRSYVATT